MISSELAVFYYDLPLALAAAVFLSLAAIHFRRNTGAHRAFGWLAVAFAVGCGAALLEPWTHLPSAWRLAALCFIPPLLALASARFFKPDQKKIPAECLILGILAGLTALMVAIPPLFTHWSWIWHSVFAVNFLFFLSVWMIHVLSSHGLHHRRLGLMGLGFLLLGLATVNLAASPAPAVAWGPLLAAAIMVFESYAFFNYDPTAVQASLASLWRFLVTFLALAGPWSVVMMAAGLVLRNLSLPWLFAAHLFFFGITIPYIYFGTNRIRNWFQRKDTRYHEILEQFVGQIYRLKIPEKLAHYLFPMVMKATALPVKIIMKSFGRDHYHLWKSDYTHGPLPARAWDLFPYLEQHPEILVRYTVASHPAYADIREAALPVMDALDVQMLIPLVQSDSLLGVIGVGVKDKPEIPRAGEMNFLRRLQNVTAMALANSYLYEQIRQLSRELWDANLTLNEKVKEKTQALEQALVQTRKVNETQREFFTMASHNLKTPLTSIKIANSLLSKGAPPEQQTWIWNIMHNNIHRLEALISDIVEILRAEQGRLELVYHMVDIRQMIQEIHQELSSLHGEKTIVWKCAVADDIQSIRADAVRLKTVLYNLLSNAYKFSPHQGQVEVHVCLADPAGLGKYPELDAAEDRAYYEFFVQDSGEGIPEEEREGLFDIFKQVSRSHKRYQGNGLGLYLSKKIIQNHGGAITLESRWGEGSLFSFVIPKYPPGEDV